MAKRLLLLLLLATALTATASAANDEVRAQSIEQSVKEPTISVSNSTVRVYNAEGTQLEVYNIAGVRVSSIRIDSTSQTVNLDHLPKGCYILRLGQTARKVYIK